MSIMNFLPVVMAGVFCLTGLLVLVIVGVVVAGIVWGFKKGNVRITTGERNFDDFGR
jgi:hypothetical protein